MKKLSREDANESTEHLFNQFPSSNIYMEISRNNGQEAFDAPQ